MAAAIETELKLGADEDALRALATMQSLGPARLGPMHEVEETDVYLDTPDRRLADARWACRLRSREGHRTISLKGPAEHAPGEALHRRPEVEGPGPAPGQDAGDSHAWPPSSARDLVLRLAGGAGLEERLTLRQRRGERQVLVDGHPVAVLSLDRVGVERAGAPLGDLRVVELELASGLTPDQPWLAGVSEALGGMPGLTPEPASKLERALQLAEGAVGEAR